MGVESGSFSLACSTDILQKLNKKILIKTTNKKKKHNKIALLTRSKLNSIESKNI